MGIGYEIAAEAYAMGIGYETAAAFI